MKTFCTSALERVKYRRSAHSVIEIGNGGKIPLMPKPPIFYPLSAKFYHFQEYKHYMRQMTKPIFYKNMTL